MPRHRKPPVLLVVASIMLLAALALVVSSCSRDQGSLSPTSSNGSSTAMGALSARNPADVALAMRAQNAHTPELLKIPDVIGTGTGVGANGRLAVLVLTRRAGVGNIPGNVDGVPTEVRVVGNVVPYAKPGGTLQCGTSTGNDLECAAGTIGAVVLRGGTKYLLSNNHVYARENAASIGEREDAPGRYDGKPRCAVTPACGTLADFQPINFSGGSNTIDCAIALMDTGRPTAVTQSGGYTASSTVVAPAVGLAVKKSGRTSGLTHDAIQAINVTIQVQYTAGIATFNGQIMTSASFIRAGDSGSLMVTETGNNPVGLCFAGGSGGAFANEIGPILSRFNATVATQ
ncbi:MAG TPA: hypothetical protein VER38_03850 [Candidatus Eisenbacteria bacterium]|nr:hypothetical protein [Candidatus Eisenbacteria bacterium]